MRKAQLTRHTTETQIDLALTIEGSGKYQVSTGIRFFDHMLELFTRHGGFDLKLSCKGDLDVDQHHTVEDVGIALGEAFDRALGDKKGINRAGYFLMPMDETLGIAAIDLSGRTAVVVDAKVRTRLVGDLQSELVYDFFDGFARGARANVHLKTMYGRSNHHKIEALFKAFARALRVACARDKQLAKMLPSTKGLVMITLVDYHAGNLASVRKAFEYLGCEVQVTEDPEVVRGSRHIVVPGVGHFGATLQLEKSGLRQAVCEALDHEALFLGICVGMQWMFQGSTEADGVPGLSLFPAMIEKFPSEVKSPHVGWNQIEIAPGSRLFKDVPDQAFVYYTHSYRAPIVPGTVAKTNYGADFSGVVERDNVFGVQFHPEKSGPAGLAMLKNFAEMA